MKTRTRLGIESLESRLVPAGQPNILFIMTDDQDVGTLQYMPRLQELLVGQGTTFENAFVTSSICGPSQLTSLTGQYTVHHGVLNNLYPSGGFFKFQDFSTDGDPATQGDESTLATWLDDAGYNTARIGKYVVSYPIDSTYIPPGWDEWFHTGSFGGARYFDYTVNDNGQLVQYGSARRTT